MRGKILLAALLLAGCDGQYHAARQAVRNILVDPDSAQFEAERSGSDGKSVCGLVNARNRMGGFTGRTPFVVADGEAHMMSKAPSVADLPLLHIPGMEATNEVEEGCQTQSILKAQCGYEPPFGSDRFCAAWKDTKGSVWKMENLRDRGDL